MKVNYITIYTCMLTEDVVIDDTLYLGGTKFTYSVDRGDDLGGGFYNIHFGSVVKKVLLASLPFHITTVSAQEV